MRARACIPLLAVVVVPAVPASAAAAGTSEQVAWVRRAATNFVTAELSRNGAGACSVLDARLRGTIGGRSCAERWDGRIKSILRAPGGRARLERERHAIVAAAVRVHGYSATIELPTPLADGPNRFRWTENCWMLEG